MTTNTVTIRGIDHCPALVIPVQPGASIIHGPPGAGKSLALEAVSLLAGGRDRGRLQPEEGERGIIEGLGVVVNVGAARVGRIGDLEAGALEEFDLGDLVDPAVRGPTRDAHGIKALLRLSGAKADPTLFHPLAGGKADFEKLVPPRASEGHADLIDLQGAVKRALEAKARDVDAEADREAGKAQALSHAGDGLDLKTAADPGALQEAHTWAVGELATLKQKAKAAKDAKAGAERARAELAKATGSGKTTADYRAEEKSQGEQNDALTGEVQRLDLLLRDARANLNAGLAAYAATRLARIQAEKAESLTAGWEASIRAAEGQTAPTDQDIADAQEQADDLQAKIAQSGVIAEAKRKMKESDAHASEAVKARKESARLKDLAKATEDVLSRAVASQRFRVKHGKLVGVLPNGEERPYYDASDGERTMIAVAEKIERTRAEFAADPARMVIVQIPQRILQDLPPSERDRLFGMAREMNACLISAQVDDGARRVEIWSPPAEDKA